MNYLILARHGESQLNTQNKFSGWIDTPLSPKGVKKAHEVAEKLKLLNFDVAFTSKLIRARYTLSTILSFQKRTAIFVHNERENKKWQLKPFEKNDIPIYSIEQLNERYYGLLQGMNKDVARKKFGEKKVLSWRRSFDAVPPEGESLKQTYERTVGYFKKTIVPYLEKGDNVLVVAHANTLRTVIKYLDNIADENIPFLELPTAEPIVYQFSKGKLEKQGYALSFARPIYWKAQSRSN